MNASKRLIWLLALVPLLLGGLLVWRFAGPDDLSPEQLRKQGFWLQHSPVIVRIPDIPDHRGETFSSAEFAGHWSLIFFGYTHCPDICGPSVALMARSLEAMQRQGMEAPVQMLMISVDPARDTPERMEAFLSRFNAELRGLLPNEHQLLAAAIPLHAVYGDASQPGLVDHTGNLVLIDPESRYIGYFRPPLSVPALLGVLDSLQQAHEAKQL